MTGEFDPLKSAREELQGLTELWRRQSLHARTTEKHLGEAETAHNDALKMEAFAHDLVKRQQRRVQQLTEEAEAKAGALS